MSQLKIAMGRTSTQTLAAPVDQDFTVSSCDFTPKASLLFMSQGMTNATWDQHIRYTIGFTDGTRERSVHMRVKNGATTSLCHSVGSNTHLFNFLNTGGTAVAGSFSFKEFIAPTAGANGGVRVTWDNELTNVFHMMHAHFGGSSVKARVGNFQSSALLNGTTSVSLGWKPDVVLFASCDANNWTESVKADAQMSIGWASRGAGDSITQSCLFWASENGQTTSNNGTSIRNNRCGGRFAASSGLTVDSMIDLTSWDSNGFTVTSKNAMGGQQFMYLALVDEATPIDTFAGSFGSETATGNKSYTDPGWRPQALFALTSLLTSDNSSNTAANSESWCFGMAQGSSSWGHSIRQDTGVTTSDCDSMARTGTARCNFAPSATSGVVYDHVSMDETGWTQDFTTVLATARRFHVLAFREPGYEHLTRRYENTPAPSTHLRM